MRVYYTKFDSSMGKLMLTASDIGISGIYFKEEDVPEAIQQTMVEGDQYPVLQETVRQLTEYFNKKRQIFDLPLDFEGTPFQVSVWKALLRIPFGETRTYGDIAMEINKEKAVRAVGQANRANRLPILIPCHRVIGKNKQLTGYAGNQVDKKEFLLKLEGVLQEGN